MISYKNQSKSAINIVDFGGGCGSALHNAAAKISINTSLTYLNIDHDEDYEHSLTLLAGAKKEVFDFFDNVKVSEENENLRKNRLELLNMLCKTFQNFINFQLLKTSNE